MSEDFLSHYGVKGMKWGIRRADHPLASGYSKQQHNYDKRSLGRRRTRRINDRISKGEDVATVRKSEHDRFERQRSAVGATIAGLSLLTMIGPGIAGAIVGGYGNAAGAVNQRANRKREEAGERMARDILSDERGITNYSSIRLHYDPVSGEWS